MNLKFKAALGLALVGLSTLAAAEITFYEAEGFRGRTFATNAPVENFANTGFNDRASSVIVGNGRWEVCEDSRFRGRCVVLRKGNYDSLVSMVMNDRISSVRRAARANEADMPQPVAAPAYEYRRRPNERILEVPVTSVREVVGPPNERCWVERQQVANDNQNNSNVGGAIAGALIGGILGHQVGGGVGKDLATAGGAVAGGVIGSKVGRNNNSGTTYQDVRRCETTASTTPAYWDVTYNYRGQEHRIQMTSPPGATIAINNNGEPRQ